MTRAYPDLPGPPPCPGEVFRLENVGIFYPKNRKRLHSDKFWALKDISFSVNEGEIVGVIGDNGAGKSTLLKVIGAILSPERGVIWRHPGKRFSLLSLQAGFQAKLTGRDNVYTSGVLLGMSRREVRERIASIEAMADIGDFFDEPIRVYSSGMRSRLGFAIAYHVDPDVMLLDEILSVGDQEFTKKSQELITGKILSGKTAVIVSHSEHLLKEMCNRLIWVGRGQVLMDNDAHSVWNEYKDHYKRRKGWV